MPRSLAIAASLSLALLAAPASARCRAIPVAEESRTSAYVFEGTLESVSDHELTFLVTAVWSGSPPQHVTVGTSARRPLASASDVGTSYLIFARGTPENETLLLITVVS